MVMVAVMHRQFAEALAGKLPGAASAHMWVELERQAPVAFFTLAAVGSNQFINLAHDLVSW